MRPLAVLALLLGAIASLFFAFVMITGSSRDDGRGTRVSRNPVVRPNVVLAEEVETESLQAPPVEATRLTPTPVLAASRDQITSGGAHIGFIYGKVVDQEDKPVTGAKVNLIRLAEGALWGGNGLSLTGDPASSKALAKAVSDAQGEFHFGAIEPGGNWGLSVSHKDFAPKVNGPILVPDQGGKEELVQLDEGRVFSGIVIDAVQEAPIEGALLSLVNPLGAFLPSTRKSKGELTQRSDAEGKFHFKNMDDSQRTLVVMAEGFATQILTSFSGNGGGSSAWTKDSADSEAALNQETIRMAPGQSISGVVLAPDRSGVAKVQITAVNQIGRFGSRAETISAADGSFELKDLGPGAFSISSIAENYQTVSKQRVQAGSTGVEIQLIEYGAVAGTVTDAKSGMPLSNFSCRVRNEHPNNPSWGVVVKRGNFKNRTDGSFELNGIREGRYVLEIQSQGYASSFSDSFAVTQGIETQDISIGVTRGSVITGVVLDAASGAPVAGAQVKSNDNNFIDNEFMKFLGGMGSSATSKQVVATDSEGKFRLELLTPDTYQIRVWKAGYTAIVVNDVNVRDVDEKAMPVFRLPRGATISGTVFDEENQSVAGASVILSPEDPTRYADQLQARADANGSFSFENVRQGSYKLQSTRPQNPGSNPFAGAVDMQNSKIQVDVSEGQSYSFDLHFASKRKP